MVDAHPVQTVVVAGATCLANSWSARCQLVWGQGSSWLPWWIHWNPTPGADGGPHKDTECSFPDLSPPLTEKYAVALHQKEGGGVFKVLFISVTDILNYVQLKKNSKGCSLRQNEFKNVSVHEGDSKRKRSKAENGKKCTLLVCFTLGLTLMNTPRFCIIWASIQGSASASSRMSNIKHTGRQS